jgi:hypothetical protein
MQLLAEIPAVSELRIAGKGRTVTASSLPVAERDWWAQLSGHERLHRFETDDPFWQASALINDSAVSQFDVIVEAAQRGAPLPDSLACIALTGSGFHGHRHRPWQALRGNLHFTSFCRLRLEAARCGAALSMLPTLAVTDLLLPKVFTSAMPGLEHSAPCWIK